MSSVFQYIIALVTSLGNIVGAASAMVTETYNKALWQSQVGAWTTIDFTGWESFTPITDQYGALGAEFTDGNDYILSSTAAFPNDGKGLNSNEGFGLGTITVQFSADMNWVAVDHPTDIRIHLYHRGALIYTSNMFIAGGNIRFGGLISSEPFDKAVIQRTTDSSVAIDDLFFGAPIPTPGALALVGLAALTPRRQRRD